MTNKSPPLFSISELADLTGKTFRTVKKRLEALPYQNTPTGHLYESTAALEAIFAPDQARPDRYNLDAERARLAHHQANKTKLEEEVLAAKLIPVEIVEKLQDEENERARARLLRIPAEAAADLPGARSINEAAAVLKRHVYAALTDLARLDD